MKNRKKISHFWQKSGKTGKKCQFFLQKSEVRLHLAELRWKNRTMSNFWQKSEFCIFHKNFNPFFAIKIQFFGYQNKRKVRMRNVIPRWARRSHNEECHISLSSLLNFQSIDIQNLEIFYFFHFSQKMRKFGQSKKTWCHPLQKMRNVVKK